MNDLRETLRQKWESATADELRSLTSEEFEDFKRKLSSNGEDYAPGERDDKSAALFKLEDWNDVSFDLNDEWLVDDVLPRRGFGLIYGERQSFKSFIAMSLALSVALGEAWGGKRVEQGVVVYIAAEGAPGMRKRIAGLKTMHEVPRGRFILISAAPNLGTGTGDLPALIAAVESAGIKPSLVNIDTASASMGGANENAEGMAALVCNAGKLAQHFDCLVLGVHHVGHDDAKKRRPRGWSGLSAALDVQLLCGRPEDEKRATLTVQKLKDGEHGICFEATLSRLVIGKDKNDKEASTLIVDDVFATQPAAQPATGKHDASAILRHALLESYDRLADTAGFSRSFDGKQVRKVAVDVIRDDLKDRGFLDMDDTLTVINSTSRSRFSRAKTELLGKKTLMEAKKLIWRP